MTNKEIERIALMTMAPYIVNRDEKVFLMDATALQNFVERVNQAHKEELVRD